jgi:uncharacterized RDD family membrane protein YckC
MQNTSIPSASSQGTTQTPDSKVLFSRYIALLIDSFVIAVLVWSATRAFGTAQLVTSTQLGTSTSIPGGLIDAGGTFYGVSNLMGGSTNWVVRLPLLWSSLFVFLYFVLQETLLGATLGKALMGLRVIYQSSDGTYKKLPFIAAVVRNLIRFLDAIPSNYLVGWIVALISPRRQRLGDLAAHTFVVSCESVPYLTRPRKQIMQGFLVIAALLLAFTIACQSFMYFGRPQLLMQNAIATDNLFSNKHIISYTLGEKVWGQDNQGQQTITYTINFVAVDLMNMPSTKMQSCQGSVTLAWHWSALDWTEESSNNSCSDL